MDLFEPDESRENNKRAGTTLLRMGAEGTGVVQIEEESIVMNLFLWLLGFKFLSRYQLC